MSLRKVKLSDIKPFPYSFGGNIKAQMGDVGRTVGSKTIGLTIQTVRPGCFSSRRHKHVFQEEILIVVAGNGTLHHDVERIPVTVGDCVCYLPEDPEPHCFENTGAADLVIWAFGLAIASSSPSRTPLKLPVLISPPPTLLLMHSIVTYSVAPLSARKSDSESRNGFCTDPPTLRAHPCVSTLGSAKFFET